MSYDDLDERIVNVLLSDGRASLRTIAAEVDVAVTTVANHLEELEEEGILRGYEPRIDYAALGYDVAALFQLRVGGEAMAAVVDDLRERDRLISIYEVTGHYDVVAVGKFLDTDEMNAEIKSLLTTPEIEEATTSVVLSTIRENRQFQLDV